MTAIPGRVPALCAGDRLTRDEFERRYAAMPQVKKAELIEGVVYMPSPVSHARHGGPHSLMATWIGNYVADTPGTDAGDNSTVRLDLDNEPQPDLLLRVMTGCGGRSRIGPEGYVDSAPELVVEVAASRVSYDLHDKLHAYRRNGVQEYLVFRTDDGEVDWFVLRESRYDGLCPDSAGVLRGSVFPGLWLDVPALVGGDGRKLRATLDRGIASPEHAALATALAAKGAKGP